MNTRTQKGHTNVTRWAPIRLRLRLVSIYIRLTTSKFPKVTQIGLSAHFLLRPNWKFYVRFFSYQLKKVRSFSTNTVSKVRKSEALFDMTVKQTIFKLQSLDIHRSIYR